MDLLHPDTGYDVARIRVAELIADAQHELVVRDARMARERRGAVVVLGRGLERLGTRLQGANRAQLIVEQRGA